MYICKSNEDFYTRGGRRRTKRRRKEEEERGRGKRRKKEEEKEEEGEEEGEEGSTHYHPNNLFRRSDTPAAMHGCTHHWKIFLSTDQLPGMCCGLS